MTKPDTFTPMSRKLPKNRRSQLVVIASVLLTLFGALVATSHQWVGWVLLAAGLMGLFGSAAWALRNWEWDR